MKIVSTKSGSGQNVSSTVIQEIRSGKQNNPTLQVLSKLVNTLGAEIIIKKGKKVLTNV
jgi:predicted transcriptional regulator